jgi:hypothetical protein
MRNSDSTIRQSRERPGLHISSKVDIRGNFDDPRWRLAQRIAVSRSMGRSPLLSEFLLYICDRHIRERSDELSEQWIGVHVFGRLNGYNSNDDNIVRNYARTLRKRVEDYFATEGMHEELKLEIPRGAYIPVFYPRTPEQPGEGTRPPSFTVQVAHAIEEVRPAEPDPAPVNVTALKEAALSAAIVDTPKVAARLPKLYLLAVLSLVVVAAIATYIFAPGLLKTRQTQPTTAARPTSVYDTFWAQLFQKNRDTFIVPADSGLVIMQGLTHQRVSLGDYSNGNYRATVGSPGGLSAADVKELGTRRYTSVVDLNLVFQLSRMQQFAPERTLVRYARDLRMDDLYSGNAILLGSADANPWVSLFEQQLNFRFEFSPRSSGSYIIANVHPLPGEQTTFYNDSNGDWHSTFGTISYVPNLDGNGHVLLIGGLTMAGTQAAGAFLLNPALMQPTLEHARTRDGKIRPFEILIETNSIASTASPPHVVSERIAPM